MPQVLYIGLMSGTSMDGIDAGLFDFSQAAPHLVASHHKPYPEPLKLQIRALSLPGDNEIDRMGELDVRLGRDFAAAVSELIEKAQVQPNDIRAIGTHGQTIRHRPTAKMPFTLQIGDPNTIAHITGITTVADLRRRDMAAGGQGAPLAPAFHEAAFFSSAERRCVLNIGGISNISVLNKNPLNTIGYDIGPGNLLMDAWVAQHQGTAYDRDGAWAAGGELNEELLQLLLSHVYFSLPYPKSTGREDFNLDWLQPLLPPGITPQNVQRTLCELSAVSISRAVSQHNGEALYVCGGGAHNTFLMTRLAALLPQMHVATTAELGIPPDWVEAGLCAWLAKQTMEQVPGNLPAVTGASRAVILGAVYPAPPCDKAH